MKKSLFVSMIVSAIVLSACAPAAVPDKNKIPTATPGSMMADNPAASHMMEPITAPNVQPATENVGGQPLEYRLEDGV